MYRQTSNISRTLAGNKIVDHSDLEWPSPVGAAPTTSSCSTSHLVSMDWARATAKRDENHLSLGICCVLYYIFYGILSMDRTTTGSYVMAWLPCQHVAEWPWVGSRHDNTLMKGVAGLYTPDILLNLLGSDCYARCFHTLKQNSLC